MQRTLKFAGGALLATLLGAIVWLAVKPPELLRVGTGYAAKIVCSNVFIVGRDAASVLADDVQAPGIRCSGFSMHPSTRIAAA